MKILANQNETEQYMTPEQTEKYLEETSND